MTPHGPEGAMTTEPRSAAEGARRADALFRRVFGGTPRGVWSAPGRVNLIGEHTDHNGGLCLPIALGHRTYVALRARADGAVRVVSAQHPHDGPATLSSPVTPGRAAAVTGWPAYIFGVASLLRAHLGAADPAAAVPGAAVPGADIAIDSCVPQGAGLSSSAALECAVACALAAVAGADIGDPHLRSVLVDVTRAAENDVVGVPSGAMDQSAALLAAAGHALLLDAADGTATPVPFDTAAMGASLLIVDTRTAHALVEGGYATRRAECAAAERALGVRTLSGADDADVWGSPTRSCGPVRGTCSPRTPGCARSSKSWRRRCPRRSGSAPCSTLRTPLCATTSPSPPTNSTVRRTRRGRPERSAPAWWARGSAARCWHSCPRTARRASPNGSQTPSARPACPTPPATRRTPRHRPAASVERRCPRGPAVPRIPGSRPGLTGSESVRVTRANGHLRIAVGPCPISRGRRNAYRTFAVPSTVDMVAATDPN